MDADNRRTSTRYPVDLDATATVGDQTHQVHLENLSLGGAFLTGLERLGIGTTMDFTFSIPTHESPINVNATVRWSTDLGVGIQFGSLRAREVWSLNKYFEDLALP